MFSPSHLLVRKDHKNSKMNEDIDIRVSESPPYAISSIPFCKTNRPHKRVYQKVSGLAAWSENCIRYSFLSLGAVVSLFCESV
jgi:hypothetical protein